MALDDQTIFFEDELDELKVLIAYNKRKAASVEGALFAYAMGHLIAPHGWDEHNRQECIKVFDELAEAEDSLSKLDEVKEQIIHFGKRIDQIRRLLRPDAFGKAKGNPDNLTLKLTGANAYKTATVLYDREVERSKAEPKVRQGRFSINELSSFVFGSYDNGGNEAIKDLVLGFEWLGFVQTYKLGPQQSAPLEVTMTKAGVLMMADINFYAQDLTAAFRARAAELDEELEAKLSGEKRKFSLSRLLARFKKLAGVAILAGAAAFPAAPSKAFSPFPLGDSFIVLGQEFRLGQALQRRQASVKGAGKSIGGTLPLLNAAAPMSNPTEMFIWPDAKGGLLNAGPSGFPNSGSMGGNMTGGWSGGDLLASLDRY